MNISLNLTLFIQIINFLIAYYFISRFFLTPALDIFVEDKNYKEDLEKKITEKKDRILDKEDYKRLNWKEYQKHYKKLIPDHTIKLDDKQFDNLHLEEIRTLDKNKLKDLVIDISTVLKSKVIND
ncbi:MAG: hypothetical protein M0R03_18710 [Novosphingobium sp.]|nr:hypothetical protein [Novosphingobium sp.]